MAEKVEIKQRRPWQAALLSLFTSGLGQVYNGQWKKGLVLFCLELAAGYAFADSLTSFNTLVTSIIVLLALNLIFAAEAYLTARDLVEYRLTKFNRWWVYSLLFAIGLSANLLIESSVRDRFQTFKIPSGSMLPTLQIGDRLVADILDNTSSIERGRVVIFRSREDEDLYFVKRIVGLPGDTFSIVSKAVMINGKPLVEPYAYHSKDDEKPVRDNLYQFILGPDEYFVMGDNREESYDSRWVGPIKRAAIFAQAKYIYFPGGGSDGGRWSRFGEDVR